MVIVNIGLMASLVMLMQDHYVWQFRQIDNWCIDLDVWGLFAYAPLPNLVLISSLSGNLPAGRENRAFIWMSDGKCPVCANV